jgi:hypothetical protein
LITSTGNREDVTVILRVVIEGLAQGRDVSSKVVLLDDLVVPDTFEDRILFDQASAMFNEDHQDLE